MAKKSEEKKVKTTATDQAVAEFFQKEPAEENQAVIMDKEDWLNDSYDGQLSIDVYQTDKEIILKSTIAGVKPEDIDISINKDMVTIRGRRFQEDEVPEENYLYRECYWGGFSRSIILPTEIKADKIKASLKNGILKVILPKASQPKAHSIKVKEEE